MKLIVGLGNPGSKYEDTRHNVGFMVVEKFAKSTLSVLPSLKAWKKDAQFEGEYCKLDNLYLLKPETFMNRSGAAVSKFCTYHKINPQEIWVVHDDIDLPIGKIRIRLGGGSGGHRGIESMIHELGTDGFGRFRLGVGRGKNEVIKHTDRNLHRREVEKYVVSPFRDSEAGDVKNMIKHAVKALELALTEGIEKTMNHFN